MMLQHPPSLIFTCTYIVGNFTKLYLIFKDSSTAKWTPLTVDNSCCTVSNKSSLDELPFEHTFFANGANSSSSKTAKYKLTGTASVAVNKPYLVMCVPK